MSLSTPGRRSSTPLGQTGVPAEIDVERVRVRHLTTDAADIASVDTSELSAIDGIGALLGGTTTRTEYGESGTVTTLVEAINEKLGTNDVEGTIITDSTNSLYKKPVNSGAVHTYLNNLLSNAPGTLDSLNEVAAIISNHDASNTGTQASVLYRIPQGDTLAEVAAGAVPSHWSKVFHKGNPPEYDEIISTPTVDVAPTENNSTNLVSSHGVWDALQDYHPIIQEGSELDAALVGDGSVSDTKFGYLSGVTSDIQEQMNGKQGLIDAANRLGADLIGANGDVSDAEYGHLAGVTSDIQTQIDGKQASGSYAAATHTHNDKQDLIDTNNRLGADLIGANGDVSDAEYGYLAGVTSDIQTQIDGKQASGSYAAATHTHTKSQITDFPTIPAAQVQSDWTETSGMGEILNKPTIPSGADLVPGSGTAGHVLTWPSSGSTPAWAAAGGGGSSVPGTGFHRVFGDRFGPLYHSTSQQRADGFYQLDSSNNATTTLEDRDGSYDGTASTREGQYDSIRFRCSTRFPQHGTAPIAGDTFMVVGCRNEYGSGIQLYKDMYACPNWNGADQTSHYMYIDNMWNPHLCDPYTSQGSSSTASYDKTNPVLSLNAHWYDNNGHNSIVMIGGTAANRGLYYWQAALVQPVVNWASGAASPNTVVWNYTFTLIETAAGTLSDDRIKHSEKPITDADAVRWLKQVAVRKYTKVGDVMTPEEEATFEAGGDGFAERKKNAKGDKQLLENSEVEIGVVAQELHKTELAHIVFEGSDYDMWKVRYNNITSLNTRVIQNLLARVEVLEARVRELS